MHVKGIPLANANDFLCCFTHTWHEETYTGGLILDLMDQIPLVCLWCEKMSFVFQLSPSQCLCMEQKAWQTCVLSDFSVKPFFCFWNSVVFPSYICICYAVLCIQIADTVFLIWLSFAAMCWSLRAAIRADHPRITNEKNTLIWKFICFGACKSIFPRHKTKHQYIIAFVQLTHILVRTTLKQFCFLRNGWIVDGRASREK